jgi:hypothetical protein
MKGGRLAGEYESGSTSASALRAMLEEAGE